MNNINNNKYHLVQTDEVNMKRRALRILFILSALLSVSALIASTTYAQNTGAIVFTGSTSGISQQTAGDYALNLSHVECVGNSVEVHFVLLGTVDGDSISSLTYTYGSIPPGKRSGNVVHFTAYVGSGYISISSASVTVNGQVVSLNNPSAYSGNYNCAPATATSVSPTNTPTDTPTNTPTNTPTDTPTNTPTSTPTDTPTSTPTNTPTNTPTDTPTNTPTNTPTDTPTNTATPTGTLTPTDIPSETPVLQPTMPPTATQVPTATATLVPTATTAPTATSTIAPTATVAHTDIPELQSTPIPTNTLVPTNTSVPSISPTNGPTPVPQKAPVTGGPGNPALLQAASLIFALISIGSFVLMEKKVEKS